ncbi:membrane integrity-associated transporter subunit PqiC [Alteromonas sp. V450]|uniref:PqiC family protein n=1 Tax=Alteromonas sp. V450 TaxID=1912139 RepID=UPI000A919E66|nr:ABC-type transport auxiliary lipoprotein family protein [Alteromonas sp. V450]
MMTVTLKPLKHMLRTVISSVFIIVFALLTLSACTSTPTSLTYYLLHSTSEVSATPTSEEALTVIEIERLVLPEYLKHRGLVYQTSDTNLHISTRHLWAEPVDEGLTKALSSVLSKHNILLTSTGDYQGGPDLRVTLHIDDFVSTYNGEVILNGHVAIAKSTGSPVVKRFALRSSLINDGYSHSIIAMRENVRQLAEIIITATNA